MDFSFQKVSGVLSFSVVEVFQNSTCDRAAMASATATAISQSDRYSFSSSRNRSYCVSMMTKLTVIRSTRTRDVIQCLQNSW